MGATDSKAYYVDTVGYKTHLQEMGQGPALLLLHGSGPGVTAAANWQGVAPSLAQHFRVLMPDLMGFGQTQEPASTTYRFMDSWVAQISALLDTLGLKSVCIVGNSFGGAVALALASQRPDLVSKLVLMGAVGIKFKITEALDTIWGYKPSVQAMRQLLDLMSYDRSRISDQLAEQRYQASLAAGVQSRYERLFPEPRQHCLDQIAQPPENLKALRQPTLLIHGEDDRVIPLEVSRELHRLIPNSELQVLAHCGHWTQIEQANRFIDLVLRFAAEPPTTQVKTVPNNI